MSRFIKRTVILAKIETEAGTDSTPNGSSNAILVSDMSIEPIDIQYVDRGVTRGFFGASEELVGPASVRCSLTVELAGSGTAATPPAWGALLRACGVAEGSLNTPSRVEYTPVSTGQETVTIYYYDDGVLHKLLGVMGNVVLSARVGQKPTLQFDFVGLDGGISAAPNPSPTLTAWKTPPVISKLNAVDVTLGCTYATGALSSGTVYPSSGLELTLGNVVNFTPLVGQEEVEISDRQATGSVELDLTAAQEVSLMGTVKAGTTQGLGFTIGTTSGNKIILHAPAAQLTRPRKIELNGKRLIGYDLRLIPSSGNDELRVACI